MTSALIGHTGFVGSNLLAQGQFDAVFNSKNIEEIQGRSFDRIVCAGARANKWLVNKSSKEDVAEINRLLSCLSTVEASQFTLISTVDVYAEPTDVTEDTWPRYAGLHAYGRNRFWLENDVQGRFDNVRVVRLPALFGPGLKKNALFDLMNGHRVQHLHPDSTYQWYPLGRLSSDLAVIEAADVDVVNLVTEPIATRDIARRFFPKQELSIPAGPPVHYDVKTKHANLWGNATSSVMNRNEVLSEMSDFLLTEAA